MKLKTVEVNGVTYAEVQDGKPVFVGDDGKDIAFDAPGTAATITRLNGEAKGHRERAEKAEASLKAFEGITDPAAAKKAMETVGNLDAKKLIDAGEVDKVKAEITKSFQAQLDAAEAKAAKLEGDLYGEKIGGAFARSKFAEEKIAVPRHMLQKTYGDAFKIEDGKVVAYDGHGNKIFSRAKPGELADFDEALELLVSADPYKDHILKGQTGAGGGAGQGDAGKGGGKTITRAAFTALAPAEQMAKAREGVTVTD